LEVILQEIDLGDDVKFNVAIKGKKYVLRELTVAEIEELKAESTSLSELLIRVGLAPEVAKSLGLSQAKKLVESMTDMISKKK
jgi:hypothetical protein